VPKIHKGGAMDPKSYVILKSIRAARLDEEMRKELYGTAKPKVSLPRFSRDKEPEK